MKKISLLTILLFFIYTEVLTQCNAPSLNLIYTTTNQVDVVVVNTYGVGVSFEYKYSVDGIIISSTISSNYSETVTLNSTIGMHEVKVVAICGFTISNPGVESIDIATVADVTCFNPQEDIPKDYLDNINRICETSEFNIINNTELGVFYDKLCFCNVYASVSNEVDNMDIFTFYGIFWTLLEENGCLTEEEKRYKIGTNVLAEQNLIQTGRTLFYELEGIEKIVIYDLSGKKIQNSVNTDIKNKQFLLNDEVTKGLFFIHFVDEHNMVLSTKKLFII